MICILKTSQFSEKSSLRQICGFNCKFVTCVQIKGILPLNSMKLQIFAFPSSSLNVKISSVSTVLAAFPLSSTH